MKSIAKSAVPKKTEFSASRNDKAGFAQIKKVIQEESFNETAKSKHLNLQYLQTSNFKTMNDMKTVEKACRGMLKRR
jgi:hypothetical protein